MLSKEENENFTISDLENKKNNYFQFLESQKLANENNFYSNSDQESENLSENQHESSYEALLSQETFSQDEENLVKKQREEIQKLDAGKSFKGSGNHKNDIDWIEVKNKYPSEEAFCETARQVLTQRQPEHMQLMIKSGQWDAFFRSAISSTLKEKMSKYRGDQVKKIKTVLFDCFPNKIPKLNSKTDPNIISEFKKSDNAKWCLHHLNSRISAASPTKYIDCITASFTKDRVATDNDQLFSIAVCHFMLEETIVGVTLDPEKMDSLMKKMKGD
ncbi:1778_t:CDS:2 [Entrophospora sp. SA101]|nr:1778_t:CDS:2 [Entrophospora sp. SA101]